MTTVSKHSTASQTIKQNLRQRVLKRDTAGQGGVTRTMHSVHPIRPLRQLNLSVPRRYKEGTFRYTQTAAGTAP